MTRTGSTLGLVFEEVKGNKAKPKIYLRLWHRKFKVQLNHRAGASS
jgi:hypothetical protein